MYPMKKIALISALFLAISIGIGFNSFSPILAQTSHSEAGDATPIMAIILITTDSQGKTVFSPAKTTIKSGEEILVLNNVTTTHSFTNGKGPNDPMAGKLFSVDINPKGFSEYLTTNQAPGNYSFYSKIDPSVKGEIVILP